jgi:cell division septum initiation protein DivIVA
LLPPYELAKKEFKKSMHGYNVGDVNEHLDFILSKYTELYDSYNELEEKCALLEADLASLKRSEDSIRRAVVNAQNSASKILKDANDKSDFILKAAQENCDKILHEFRQKVKSERSELFILKNAVAEFKKNIFLEYQSHLEYLEKISPDYDVDEDKWNLSDKDLVTKAISQIMFDVSEAQKNKEQAANADQKDLAVKESSDDEHVKIATPKLEDSILEDLVNNRQALVAQPDSNDEPKETDEFEKTVVNMPKVEVSEEEANLFKEILGD